MKTRISLGWLLVGATVSLVALGCGSGTPSGGTGTGGMASGTGGAGGAGAGADHTVVLYSWWTNPGEAEALRSLVDAYKLQYPGASVNNMALAVHGASEDLLNKTIDTTPPDVFQYNGYKLSPLVAAHAAR